MGAIMNSDLERAARPARKALAVLAAELGEQSSDTALALAIIEQMLTDIEAGLHPLDRPDDWPQRDHWPGRPHWDRWRWAIKAIAAACGATAHCSPKYHYMRVDVRQARSDALSVALDDIGCLIELVSDRECNAITVSDLIEQLRKLPPDLPVMLPCEAGVDHARAMRVADVARRRRDWTGTPVGQYREIPNEDTVGPPIRAVIIDLEGAENRAHETAMKHKQIPADGEPTGTIDDFFHVLDGKVKAEEPVTIEGMNEVAAAGWAGELGTEMESVRLTGDPLHSQAGVDEIITRGDRKAFVELLHAIIAQPDGPVADRVRTLYERVHHRAGDPEFVAWPQYQTAYWLTTAMREFR